MRSPKRKKKRRNVDSACMQSQTSGSSSASLTAEERALEMKEIQASIDLHSQRRNEVLRRKISKAQKMSMRSPSQPRGIRKLIEMAKTVLRRDEVRQRLEKAETRRLNFYSMKSNLAKMSAKEKVSQVLRNAKEMQSKKTEKIIKTLHEKLTSAEQRRYEIQQEKANKARSRNTANMIRTAQIARSRSHRLEKARQRVQEGILRASERRGAKMKERQEKITSHLEKVAARKAQMRSLRKFQSLFREKRRAPSSSPIQMRQKPRQEQSSNSSTSKKKTVAVSNKVVDVVVAFAKEIQSCKGFGHATDLLIKGGRQLELKIYAFLKFVHKQEMEKMSNVTERMTVHPRVLLSALLCAYHPTGIFGSNYRPSKASSSEDDICGKLNAMAISLIRKIQDNNLQIIWKDIIEFEQGFKEWKALDAMRLIESMKHPYIQLSICEAKYKIQLEHINKQETKDKDQTEALQQLLEGTQKQLISFERRIRRMMVSEEKFEEFKNSVDDEVNIQVEALMKSGEIFNFSPRQHPNSKSTEQVPPLTLPPNASKSKNAGKKGTVRPSMGLGEIMQNSELVHQMLLDEEFKLPVKPLALFKNHQGKSKEKIKIQSMESLQRNAEHIARQAFWDHVVDCAIKELDSSNTKGQGVLCNVLKELTDALCGLVPRNKRFCENIREHLDAELIQNMISADVFSSQMLVDVVNFINEQIINLEAPARNATTTSFTEEILNTIASCETKQELIKCLPMVYQFGFDKVEEIKSDTLNAHLNWVAKWLQTADRGIQYERNNFCKKYNIENVQEEDFEVLGSKIPVTVGWIKKSMCANSSNSSNTGSDMLRTFISGLVSLVKAGTPLSASDTSTPMCPETLQSDARLLDTLQNAYQACICLSLVRLIFRQYTARTRKSRNGKAEIKLNHFCEKFMLDEMKKILFEPNRQEQKGSMLDQMIVICQKAIACCMSEGNARNCNDYIDLAACFNNAKLNSEQSKTISSLLQREMKLSSKLMQVINKRFSRFIEEQLLQEFGLKTESKNEFAGVFIQNVAKENIMKPLNKLASLSFKVHRDLYTRIIKNN